MHTPFQRLINRGEYGLIAPIHTLGSETVFNNLAGYYTFSPPSESQEYSAREADRYLSLDYLVRGYKRGERASVRHQRI